MINHIIALTNNETYANSQIQKTQLNVERLLHTW